MCSMYEIFIQTKNPLIQLQVSKYNKKAEQLSMNKKNLYNTIVIKIGTNVITHNDGKLNLSVINNICKQVSHLHKKGIKILLVSSGAMGAGRAVFPSLKKNDSVEFRQVLASIGQPELIHTYRSSFKENNIKVGQILLTKSDFKDREHYLNIKTCINALWKNNIIPIINENDAVSITELMFTDNDELSGLIASMINADALILATNVDGIYNGSPNDEKSKVIPIIKAGKNVKKYIHADKSLFGRGGMLTKVKIAKKIAKLGITIHVVNGKDKDFLKKIFSQKEIGTTILSEGKKSNIKRWLAFSDRDNLAYIVVDDGLRRILMETNKVVSILPVGIIKINGKFKKGDIIEIRDTNNNKLGNGKTTYSSTVAKKNIKEKNSRALIRYNFLYIKK